MRSVGIEEILQATGGVSYARHGDEAVRGVAIDSRVVGKGELFFAILGARSDGHTFLSDVRAGGCHAVVVSDEAWAQKMTETGDMTVVLVRDTTRALMDLATAYLGAWSGLRKVGVTGSVGKTSTKEMVHAVLSSRYRTGKNKGNLNSEYGIPLTIFDFEESIEAAVIEMGAGSETRIADLTEIVKPDVAIVTNVGTSHLEAFGTREALAEEKLRVAQLFDEKNTLIVNTDCDLLEETAVRRCVGSAPRLLTVGTGEKNNYILRNVCDMGIDGVKCILDIHTEKEETEVELCLPVIGAHNLGNAALAVAAGSVFDIPAVEAVRALGGVALTGKRLEVRRANGIAVIDDTYNASPESMKAALRVLANSAAERRVAILGDMFELGKNAEQLHGEVGAFAAEKGIDLVIAIGSMARAIVAAAAEGGVATVSFSTKEEAIPRLRALIRLGDAVLVKASRGMALEDVVDALV